MVSGQLVSSVEESANRALARVYCRRVRNKLRFASSKSNSMVLTKKLKYDDPLVHMNGEQITLVGEISLLGLNIDRKLTFIPHVAKACKKATSIYKVTIRFVRLGTGDRVREATWLYKVKHGKDLGDTFSIRNSRNPCILATYLILRTCPVSGMRATRICNPKPWTFSPWSRRTFIPMVAA
ncbi:hypothetical protein EVAR_20941_1 [Eumeta japonica]|uniref:Uncharacterized protein n=1 Tax=Eumeta variegata TaxID=151549 RepID=A0A4C1UWU2_EUMVA|nr:hypothetical protein EVAR_20941_1 [Eumeta japonica]